MLEDVAITIDTRVERASLAQFTGSDRRGIFMADRVAIETDRGELLHERFDPRLGFKDHSVEVAWDALQVAYFIAVPCGLRSPCRSCLPNLGSRRARALGRGRRDLAPT